MGREKRAAPGVATGDHAKERHKRDRKGNVIDWTAPLPPGLVARPEQPRLSSKHKSWFEFVENKDKKKKLEFEFTEKREPPPGFEFVPIGNPALTTACKELSREQDAMIFIVTTASGLSKRLSSHLNRVGHHIRQTIVEQARATLGDDLLGAVGTAPGLPEPIPEKQEDINKQADAAIRDLFPRIPNTDRQMIIEHAFNKSRPIGKEGPPVGLAADVTLSRRVQLAVLAHIRHNHTRYDQLLRETTYVNARKAVESLCLDILVKWRGDEETGRDQLDEILCEVIVISDSESDESDDDEEEDESSSTSSAEESPVDRVMRDGPPVEAAIPPVGSASAQRVTDNARGEGLPRASHAPQKIQKNSRKDKRSAKWAQRGFTRYRAARYEAARDQAWHQAVERQRLGNDGPVQPTEPVAMDRSASHGPQPWRTGDTSRPDPGLAAAPNSVEPTYHAQRPYGAYLPDVSRERGRVNELQQPIPVATYHVPQQVRSQEYPPRDGYRPVVEPSAAPYRAPEVERVSYHGQDLKDYLVQSIEPASPGPSDVSQRLAVSHRQPEAGLTRDEGSVRMMDHYRDPMGRGGESTPAQGYHAAYADEGFIRLPPRPGPGRAHAPPDHRPEPFILLNPQPGSAATGRGAAAASHGSSLRHSLTWEDDPSTRGEGPGRRPGTRPLWIGHDGAVLRSESRPIIIQDHASPSRLSRPDAAYVPSENRRPSPTRWTDARHPPPVWVDKRDGREVNSEIDQRVESLRGDFVEIVRVSNKFPRQYEPRPAPATARYNLRSVAPQPNPSQQPDVGVAQYNTGHPLAPGQRVERVVGRVEVPFPDENSPFVARPPDGYARQERVVGIQYVQSRPSVEPGTYSDRDPFYNARDRVYRSRSNSAVPGPYSGPWYQPHTGRPTPKRDEVVLLD